MNVNEYDEHTAELIEKVLEYKYSHKRGRQALCKELLSKAKELNDEHLLGYAYYHYGDCLYHLPKQQEKSRTYIKKALVYCQKYEDYELLTRIYNLLGIDSSNRGLEELSLEYYMMSRDYANRSERLDLKLMINFNIGYSFMDMENNEGAMRYFMESYRYCKKCGMDSNNALYCRYMICCVAGRVYLSRGKIKQAEKMKNEMEKLAARYGARVEEAMMEPLVCMFLIDYYNAIDDYDTAEQVHEEFLTQLCSDAIPADSMVDLVNFCQYLIEDGKEEQAYKYIVKLQPAVETINIPHINMAFYKMMESYYEAIADEKHRLQSIVLYFENSKRQAGERKKAFSFYLEMMDAVQKIQDENIELSKQARTDSLTRIPNRMDMQEVSEQLFQRARAEGKSLGVEIFDIDKFKEYNDEYGHQVGDICLQEIGNALKRLASENIYVARYGGDEFFICYYDMTDEEILEAAKGLRSDLASIRIPTEGKVIEGISVSQGIRNTVPTKDNKLWDYYYAADSALYELKRKNRGDILILHKTFLSHKSLHDAIVSNE